MPQPQIPPMQQHVPEAQEQQGARQQREEKPPQAPQAAFCGEGRSAGLRPGTDASVKMQGDISAEDSSATAQPAAKSSVAADLREGHQCTGGCSADQIRAEDEPATATQLAQMKDPGAAAGTRGCGSEDSSSRRNHSDNRDPGGRGNTKPTAAVAAPPADTVGSSAAASAALITKKLNAAAAQVAGEAAASLSARTATGGGIQLETAATRETGATPTRRAAPRPVRSSQEGLGDAALSRRVCAAVQLLVKTLVSTEDIVVSLAEMPQALRERPATLSFATVRAKILFSRYFFKNLKIYKAKRTRSFAVPAVVHTETGLIHASGSPIDWPRGLAALVLAAEDPAAAAGASTWPAAPAVPAAGRAGMLPTTRTDDDGAAARARAAGGWASPAPVVSVSSAPGAPSVTAAGATDATAASSAAAEVARTAQQLGVTSSTTLPGETLPSPQHRYSSKDSNSSSNRSTAATQKSKRSGDSPGSRSSPSEESSKASVLTSGSDTSFPEGGADSASQQPFLNPTPQHQHGWNTMTAARGEPGLPSTGRGIPVYATETAALNLSTCSSAARTAAAATGPTAVPGPTGEAGSTAAGGPTAPSGPAAAGVQNVAAAGGKSTVLAAAEKREAQGAAGAGTAAATATLYALVQGRDSSRLAAECSVRDIVSNRFLHRHGAAGGFTEEQRIIWEKSNSAPAGGAGPFEEREDFLKSSSSPFTLVSFVFSPLADKGVLSQSKDAAAERAVGAAQQAPAATNRAAARTAAASAGGQGGGEGGTAAARGREAAADPNGGQQEEEERRRGHSPRGVSFASGREDALKAASAAAAGAAAGTWGGDSCSASSTREEECARINSLLQNEKLLGIRGSEKTGGTSKKKPRYKVSCSVVCGGDSWAIGRIELGSHCMSGQRSYNEDRVCVLPVLDTQDGSRKRPNSKAMFCAVYDGHNGEDAVNYVLEHLHRNIAKSKAFHGDMLKAIRAGFMATDTALRAMVCERIRNVGYDDDDVSPFSSGSTACTALLRGTQLYVGNLGDSRCVLSRAARSHLITVDHSCRTNAEEQRRVKQDGGHFDTDGYLSGALGVSRAFGAFDKKGGQKLSGLSGEPEIHRETLRREDEFMIIACDGVFDVVSCQEAVTCVRTHLREGKSADDAAMGLCQLAFQRHSLDNLSAVVAVFQSPEPLQKERLEKKEKRPTQHSRVPGETESSAAGGEGCRPRRKVINFSALKGLL